MEDLTEVEKLIWSWIEKDYVGKENAVSQNTLFGALEFYPEIKTPKTFRQLRKIMRGLKQKRPILESLSGSPGYHKPKNWEEINSCLERRRKTAIRQLSLNKQMLRVCKDLFPNEVAEQLRLFDEELLKDLDTSQKGEEFKKVKGRTFEKDCEEAGIKKEHCKIIFTRQFGKNGVKVVKSD